MTIFFIPDREKFLNTVEKSSGEIMLHMPDGNRLDLKRSQNAREIFRSLHIGTSGLCISLSDAKDMPAFLRYMMEARAKAA